jgi:predicted nucleic acid-binding protein
MALTYIDANVLVYALHPQAHPKQAAARRKLDAACEKEAAVTCALVVDELVWALRRSLDASAGLAAGRLALVMPGLAFAPVRRRDVARALDLAEAYDLAPRDAIHAAVALEAGCGAILTDDDDLAGIQGLRRIAF